MMQLSSAAETGPEASRVMNVDYLLMIRSYLLHQHKYDYIRSSLFHSPICFNPRQLATIDPVGHQLQNLQELEIPTYDLGRYQNHLQSLVLLTSIIFDIKHTLEHHSDGEEYSSHGHSLTVFAKCFEFTQALVQHKSAHVQRDNSTKKKILRLDVAFHCPALWYSTIDAEFAYQSQFYDFLPPLYRPKILTPSNWQRFLAKANVVQLDDVQYISTRAHPRAHPTLVQAWQWSDLEKSRPQHFSPNPAAKLLQRCRSLRSIVAMVTEPEFFQWAVDEKAEAVQHLYQHHHQQQQHEQYRQLTRPLCPSLRLVPLTIVQLTCNGNIGLQIVNDVMDAFSNTITTAFFKWSDFISPTFTQHPSSILGKGALESPWRLPKLDTLVIEYPSLIRMHPDALDACPGLQFLHIRDIRHLPEDSLHLTGYPAVLFNPATLQSTPNLEKLVLEGPRVRSIMSSTKNNPDKQATVWSWSWDLPRLRSLALNGMFASRFRFLMALRHLPQLHKVKLEVGRHKRRLFEERDEDDDNNKKDQERLHHHHGLRDLHLSGEWIMTDTDLDLLLSSLTPRLAALALHYCKGYTTQGLIRLTSLHEAHLKRCESSRSLTRSMLVELGLERRPDSATLCRHHPVWRHVGHTTVLWNNNEEDDDVDRDYQRERARVLTKAKAYMARFRRFHDEEDRVRIKGGDNDDDDDDYYDDGD
ncbi:hypothetical protein DFQ27_005566 [Actinomortierella ambigua]|uniref:Uncharacterized protein n=1 Tax=Actinomortierella ambigua TaxID=1343610 RepID=A0A9P6QJF7_9FUNG|nr:hypothetical protein DFQ27_005566 [Actinomortierella ambigua]